MPDLSSALKSLPIPCSAILAFTLIGCLLDGKEAKRGSVVENEVLAGRLVLEDGKPAAGAIVRFFPVDHVPKSGLFKAAADTGLILSAVTDADGRYRMDSIPYRTYNVLGELGGNRSFRDSVTVVAGTDSVPQDTLRAPGAFAAAVALEPNHDPRTVFAQVLGTDRFANADASGRLLLPALAPGTYSLRVVTTLPDYAPLFTDFRVRSARIDTLPDTLRPAYTGIPVVRALRASYDTARTQATLSWSASRYRFHKEYLVFRSRASDLVPPILPIARTTDTFFVDDLSLETGSPSSGIPSGRFEYRVKVRNQTDQDGLAFGHAAVEAAPASLVRTTMSFSMAGRSRFASTPMDTLRIILDWANPTRDNATLSWFVGGSAEPLRKTGLSGRRGTDTLVWTAPGEGGEYTLKAVALDEAGSAWDAEAVLSVLEDRPIADAGKDTTVSISDAILLKGKGFDGAGRIRKWEWDLGGSGRFIETSSGDTAVKAGPATARELYVLRVTDDDGRTGLDTLAVTVIADPPRADAGADTSVTVSDSFRLRGRGTDGLGKVVSLEWDLGGTGRFAAVSGGDTALVSSAMPGNAFHVLRVTDDDGQIGLDTIRVQTVDDRPEVLLGSTHRPALQGGGYRLYGQVKDRGRIVKWEWRIGSDSPFITGSGSDTSFIPQVAGNSMLTCALRVTDEDGNMGTHSIEFEVSKWSYVTRIPHTFPVNKSSRFSIAAHEGKICIGVGRMVPQLSADRVLTYDPKTDDWGELPPMKNARTSYPLVSLMGRLYAVGGQVDDQTDARMEAYDPGLGEWLEMDPMRYLNHNLGALAFGGKLLITGGTPNGTIETYDPSLDEWAPRKKWSENLAGVMPVAVGGRIFLKFPHNAYYTPFFRQLLEYDYGKDSAWTQAPLSDFQGQRPTSMASADGKIYLVQDGWESHRYQSQYVLTTQLETGFVWSYNPATGIWAEKSKPMYGAYYPAVTTLDGHIYFLGNDGVLQSYSPAEDP